MKLEQPSENRLTRRNLLAGVTSLFVAAMATPTLAGAGSKSSKWDGTMELAVDLELAAADGGRFHRPYVVIWIQDKEGKDVRTLTLWCQTTGRGTRWLRDLRAWFAGETTKMAAGGKDLYQTVSSATRNPGKYSVVWDGKDDDGKLVELGTYNVCIEAAREHGTYQLIRKEVALGKKALKLDLPGGTEIKGASIDYRKRK